MNRFIAKSAFLLILTTFSTFYAVAQTTVTFNEITTSTALSLNGTNTYDNTGVRFQIFSGSNSGANVSSATGGVGGTRALDDTNTTPGGVTGWKITKVDGTAFQLLSIWLQEGCDCSSTTGTIKAFKSGAQVGATVNVTFDSNTTGAKNFSANPDFYDIDEIRIEGIDLYVYIDNFSFGTAINPVDADPPLVTSISLVGSPLTTTASVNYSVTFSKAAKNVSSDDFQLTTAGTIGAVGAVSGSGSSYTVVVNNLDGEGTVRLDLKAGTNIANVDDITGTPAFTSGQLHYVGACFVETFETETDAAATFSGNGVNFSLATGLEIEKRNGFGAGPSNGYVKNNDTAGSFFLSSSSEFTMSTIDLYLSNTANSTAPTATGTVTITGMKGGVDQYIITKNSGFPTTTTSNNGYFTVNFATDGAANYRNINVDELVFTISGGFIELAIDNMNFCEAAPDIDSQAPVVQSISKMGNSLSTSSAVNFQVAFDENASNVTLDDFTLLRTGTATGALTGISGSGSTYTLGVTGISGEGSIQIKLNAVTDIADALGNTPPFEYLNGEIHLVGACYIETFESFIDGVTSFSSNGKGYTLGGNWAVNDRSGFGINASSNYLENTGVGPYTLEVDVPAKFSKLALFLTSNTVGSSPPPTNDGAVTIRGKNGATTAYTITKSTGFPTDFTSNSGYFYIDFATEGGADNSNTYVDGLEIEIGGAFVYLALDNLEFCSDFEAPSGYSVVIDQDPISQDNNSAVSFTFAGAEIGATYDYTFSSAGGGTDVPGTGAVTSTTEQILGIDLSGLGDGTVTLTVTLTDPSGNEGADATDTKQKISNNPPIASAKNLEVTVNENCQAIISAIDFNNGSSDPDGDELTFSVSPAGPYPVGETIVILSVSDGLLTSEADPVTITVNSDAPTIDGITPGITSLSVDFTSGSLGGPAISNYEYSIDNGANWITINPAQTNSPILIDGLSSSFTYQVQLRAVYDQGVSCESNMFEGTTLDPIQLDITVTPNQSKVFGTGDPVFTYSATGFQDGDTEAILTGALARDVGENVGLYAINQGDLDAGLRYNIIFTAADFEITPLEVNVTAQSDTKDYDGTNSSSVSPIGDILQGTDAWISEGTQSYDDENAGTGKTITASGASIEDGNGGANYSINYVTNSEGVINKIDATITVTRASGDYNGNPFEAMGEVTGLGETALSPLVTFEYQQFESNNWSGIDGAPTDAGAYRVRSNFEGNTNYNAGSSDWTAFAINKIAATITVTRASGDYNGNPFEAMGEVTGLVETALSPAVTFEYQQFESNNWSGIAGAPTDAGAYRVRSNFEGNTNYNAGSSDWTAFAINKIAATITVTRASGDFNGNPFEAMGEVTGLGETALSPSVTFDYQEYDGSNWAAIADAPINAGDYRVRSNFAGNTNYNAGSSDWTSFAINKIAATITVTRASGDYDGNPFEATGDVTGLGETSLNPSVTFEYQEYNGSNWAAIAGAPINAGAYRVRSNFAGNMNYTSGSSDWTAFEINQIAATITVTRASGDYDGNPFEATGDVTGLGETSLSPPVTFEYQEYDGSTWSGIAGAPTDAGDYRVRSNFAGNTNYSAGSSDWTAFAINKIAATITVARAGGDYDGNPFVATGSVKGLGEVDLSPPVTFEYQEYDGSTWSGIAGAPTDAGDYRVRSNFAGNTNYSAGSSDWTAFAINKIDATITVTGYTGTYDAAAHGATGSAIGLADEILAGLDLGASFTIVPGGIANWTFTDVTGNYNDKNGSVVIEITKAPTTITINNAVGNCDGDNVTLTATVKTVNTEIQSDVNSLGGVVTFKTGSTTIGVVNVVSVTDGVFSGTFAISLAPGAAYSISAEFVPNSGNLIDSQTQTNAQLTVFEAFISSSIAKNENGNVVIFDGAASSLGLPSSTLLTATYQPSSYPGVTYKWYSRNEGGSFSLISGAMNSTYQVLANGDFVKEYMVELIVDGNCVGNTVFSKIISVEASCGKEGQNKVQVCQITPNGKRKTICVSANAVEALLAESPGSFVGSCRITYRVEKEPELITVPWNTPIEVIEKKIASMSSDWFEGKDIKLKITTDSYNALQPGSYLLKTELMDNEWFDLEEPITVNVLVADKPLATDIRLSNSILLRNINAGTVIGNLSTIDPVDDQHTYSMSEQADFELVGQSLIWKGTAIPATVRITVFSTDRAGQTIERVIELSREPRFGDFTMFPNPASSDVNLEVELEQSMNVGIRIYDAVGRLVHEQEGVQSGNTSYKIAIDNLSPGLYTVQVKTGQIVMNKRLIKK
jgi:hypothetical protein